jgi:hypothetical protein
LDRVRQTGSDAQMLSSTGTAMLSVICVTRLPVARITPDSAVHAASLWRGGKVKKKVVAISWRNAFMSPIGDGSV